MYNKKKISHKRKTKCQVCHEYYVYKNYLYKCTYRVYCVFVYLVYFHLQTLHIQCGCCCCCCCRRRCCCYITVIKFCHSLTIIFPYITYSLTNNFIYAIINGRGKTHIVVFTINIDCKILKKRKQQNTPAVVAQRVYDFGMTLPGKSPNMLPPGRQFATTQMAPPLDWAQAIPNSVDPFQTTWVK